MGATGRVAGVAVVTGMTLLWLLAAWALVAEPVEAHELEVARADAEFSADGSFAMRIRTDVAAYLLEQPAAHTPVTRIQAFAQSSDAEAAETWELRRRAVATEVWVEADGRLVELSVEFPELKSLREWAAAVPTPKDPLAGIITVRGVIPPGTAAVRIGFPPSISKVQLNVRQPGIEDEGRLLDAGMASPPIRLRFSRTGAGGHSQPETASPQPQSQPAGGHAGARTGAESNEEFSAGTFGVIVQYLELGFTHILPEGLDHILFVLGLFLLAVKLRPLLWQVTAFTVAHTITLALAARGVFTLDGSIVEPLIALSISFVAIENLFTSTLHVWRPLIVFGFGLIHGMGFAGVLGELGLPKGQFVPALISFNIGVELGQLTVIAAALLLVGWFRNARWYRPRIVIPGSAIIAAVGLYWTIERIWFPDGLLF